MEARGWYPDGSPCPYSRVIKGRGVILRYEKDYKPGKSNNKGRRYSRTFGDLPVQAVLKFVTQIRIDDGSDQFHLVPHEKRLKDWRSSG